MAQSAGVPRSRSTRSAVPSAAPTEQALQFAETLARSCSRALGETVAGVILHGSLTLGDYLPGSSDVDLLVVVDEPLTDRQLAALTEAAAGHRLGAPGAGSGVQVERRHPGERDLVVEFSMCRAHGRSLVGAAPAELLGEFQPSGCWPTGRRSATTPSMRS
jgi:predicted nucleotidyltransferase